MRTWTEQLARIKELETDLDAARELINVWHTRAEAHRQHAEAAELRAAALEAQLEQALDGSSLVTQLADEHARLLDAEDRLEQARALVVRMKHHVSSDDDPLLAADIAAWLAAHPAPAAGEMNDG